MRTFHEELLQAKPFAASRQASAVLHPQLAENFDAMADVRSTGPHRLTKTRGTELADLGPAASN